MGHTPKPACASCGATATVFITFAKDGKNVSRAWCEKHAAENGVFDADTYALLERAGATARRTREPTARCPACDCSQRDFEHRGRYGCPTCYSVFAGMLPPLLKRMHRGAVHRGKIPTRSTDPATVRQRLEVQQAELSDPARLNKGEGLAQTHEAIAALEAKLPDEAGAPPGPARPPSRPAR